MELLSLFSGCGGLDLGFTKAGFKIIWANEKDPSIVDTYKVNHKKTFLDTRSIVNIPTKEIPNGIGIIGGPPCQSWSSGGKGRGMDDERGKLFLQYIRVIRDKKPLFFLIENVAGMVSKKHISETKSIISKLERIGYIVSHQMINAKDYGIPQSRKRVFFIGYRKDLGLEFRFPKPVKERRTVKDSIIDLSHKAVPFGNKSRVNNHEYMITGYSYIFMSRNRVLDWDKPAYTVQANGRHASLHPIAPKMELVKKDVRKFVKGKEHLYRRLTVREAARLQTFPDNFIFRYKNINDGYKMVGNAVPVDLAFHFAKTIKADLQKLGD